MKFTLALASLFFFGAAAFAPSAKTAQSSSTALNALNGWVPDKKKFAYGLPGAVAPFTEGFDPAGFAGRESLETMKAYRESEVTHGRVAMLAILGFLVTEAPLEFHPLFNAGEKDIGPAIRHLDEVRAVAPVFFEVLAVSIGAFELIRALKGWEVLGKGQSLRDDYYPGDLGFDPLGLKPDGADEFAEMQTKELNNGRLAMLGVAGFIVQELVNGKEILVTLGLAPDNFDPSTLPVKF